MPVRENWTKEKVIYYGKKFLESHDKLTQKDLRAINHLPTSKVINDMFGSLENYQSYIGSPVALNRNITEEDIMIAVDDMFKDKERIISSRKEFFKHFQYSKSVIERRYPSFRDFCEKYHITVVNQKKSRYTKQEIDDAIIKWVKSGKDIPSSKDLVKEGLPSSASIMKYYDNWKEPFLLHQAICDKYL